MCPLSGTIMLSMQSMFVALVVAQALTAATASLAMPSTTEEWLGVIDNTLESLVEVGEATGATGATAAAGATGATGATGVAEEHPLKKLEKKVKVVSFKGRKHVPHKGVPSLNQNRPIEFQKRIHTRTAQHVIDDVWKDFPDKIWDFTLSEEARCVDWDPYFPQYYNPRVLKNPTPLRVMARKEAFAAHKVTGMTDMHKGADAVSHHLVAYDKEGVELEAHERHLDESARDRKSVDIALNATYRIRDYLMDHNKEATDNALEAMMKDAKENEIRDAKDETADAAREKQEQLEDAQDRSK